jgi:flagellin FlaB
LLDPLRGDLKFFYPAEVDEEIPSTMNTKQRGITGLETAIILIAFVVVASVFAFTVLSTGVFATERSKETIFAGLEQTKSSLRPSGSVIAFKGFVGSTEAIFKFSMVVEPVSGGEPIDLTAPYSADGSGTDPDVVGTSNRTSIVYIDDNQIIQDVPWSVSFMGNDNGDEMLDEGEKAEIVVWLLNRTTATDVTSNSSVNYMSSGGLTSSGTLLTPNDQFTVEVQPADGSVLTIRRTLPAALDTVVNLR